MKKLTRYFLTFATILIGIWPTVANAEDKHVSPTSQFDIFGAILIGIILVVVFGFVLLFIVSIFMNIVSPSDNQSSSHAKKHRKKKRKK